MSVIVVVEWKAKTGNGAAMREKILSILPDTRSWKGCQWLELIVNQDDPDNLVVWERWDDRASYEDYLKWRVDAGMVATLRSMAVGGPSIRFYDTIKDFP